MSVIEPKPPDSPAPRVNLEDALISNVLRLDRGDLATLKRNAGNSLGEARNCLWFYRVVPPPLRGEHAEACFMVATLMASATRWLRHQQTAERGGDAAAPAQLVEPEAPEGKPKRSRSFGAAMARLKQERSGGADAEEGPIDRRFGILLDAYLELQPDGTLGGDLPYRLRQMVRLADAGGVAIDWAELLRDVRNWNNPGKRVQKRWAREFYDPRSQTGSTAADAGAARTPDLADGETDAN